MARSPQDLRIIFMGTPDFAVSSLEAMLNAGFNIVGVVTAPDKPAGRGMKLTASAVKQFAEANNLQILQPAKLKEPEFLEQLKQLNADLQVVVAFRMLPEQVWNMPPMGTINVHGSLLPQYRGAAPINWAIINGEKETGVTTFKLKHEIDTGDILLQERMPIGDEETAGELHDRMKIMGAQLLVKTIEGLAAGTLKETPQENSNQLKHAPKIFTGTCKIDWARPGTEVHNLIRGLSPYPGAFTTVNQKIFKIFRSKKIDNYSENTSTVLSTASAQKAAAPGSLFTDRKSYLRFRCADGLIEALEVQFEGKKRMQIDEFLRGYGAQLPEKTG